MLDYLQNTIFTVTRVFKFCAIVIKVVLARPGNKQLIMIIIYILFHHLTRTAYLYNGCLTWYKVVLPHGSTQA